VSNDNDKKNTQLGGDWETALEEWDESPLVPALADDKTPAPPGVASTPPAAEVAEGAAASDPTGTPTSTAEDSDEPDEDEDEECTVVGEIPAELLADSVRGLGSASGLGEIFGRGSQPTLPADDETEPAQGDAPLNDDSQVFTSAASVGTGRLERAERKTPAPSKPDVIREDAIDEEVFDPFVDLRDDAVASPESRGDAWEGSGSKAVGEDGAEAPAASRAEEATPIPSSDLEGIAAEGPKLLEPGQRRYPEDEITAVFADERAVDKLVARGAAKSTAKEPEQPSGVPRSVPPPPPVPAKPQFSDERDAVAHLLERDLRQDWEDRAVWLAEEAAAREEGEERARMMLTVSELCAMVGDDEKGVAVARAVRELDRAHPLAHRQVRYAMVRERRWYDVLGELEAEARHAPTPDAKAHAILLAAELMSRLHNDEDGSSKHFDLAARVLPSDPRPYVSKLVHRFNDPAGGSLDVRWPDDVGLAPLAKGAAFVGRVRDAREAPAAIGDELSEYEAIPRAKAALRNLDPTSAAYALRKLESVRGMGGGANWLAASLAGQHRDGRARSTHALEKLASGPHASVAQRLMALRAVESNDVEALDKATSMPGASTFSPADRVALNALFRDDFSAAGSFADMLLGQEKTAALGAAAVAAITEVKSEHAPKRVDAACAVGSPATRTFFALARGTAAGDGPSEFAERVRVLCAESPDAAVGKLLDVDEAVAAGELDKLVDLLSAWGQTDGLDERDRALAAGLVAELQDDKVRARLEYERARQLDPGHEGVLRALAALDLSGHVSRLAELASEADEGTKASLLSLEAAIRTGPGEVDEYLAHLQHAQDFHGSLPFPAWLGERLARGRGDVDGVLDWLRTRRESTDDPVEAAYDACREAMLMVERDPGLAASLMEEASRARPADSALRALFERFSEEIGRAHV